MVLLPELARLPFQIAYVSTQHSGFDVRKVVLSNKKLNILFEKLCLSIRKTTNLGLLQVWLRFTLGFV